MLFVEGLARSRRFYTTAFPVTPLVDAPRYCELAGPELHLGLLERSALPSILGPEGSLPRLDAAPRCELYVRIAPARAAVERAGGRVLSPRALRDWGETVAYFADPDGHVIAVAELAGEGSPPR